MQNADTLAVAEVFSVAADATYSSLFSSDHTAPSFLIGVHCKEQSFAESLVQELREAVRFLPIARLAICEEGEGAINRQHVLLVTDLSQKELQVGGGVSGFASVLVIGDQIEPADEGLIFVPDGEELGSRLAMAVMQQLFSVRDENVLALQAEHEQLLSFIEHVGKELSVFYHNINNPLTILSGNIQLLQLMADSVDISDELMKPILDIATVSSRFQTDLQSIAELKERIRAGNLQKEVV